MKVIVSLLIAVILIVFVNAIMADPLSLPDPVKNFIGSMKGYGTCPNCGSSWYWAKSGSIPYKNLEEQKDFTLTSDSDVHPDVVISSGVMICKRCLHDPSGLNIERIGKNLLKYGWQMGEVFSAERAIDAFKQKGPHH